MTDHETAKALDQITQDVAFRVHNIWQELRQAVGEAEKLVEKLREAEEIQSRLRP